MPDVDDRDRRLNHLARGPRRGRRRCFDEPIEDGVERHANQNGAVSRELQHGGVLGLVGVAGHDHRGDPDGMPTALGIGEHHQRPSPHAFDGIDHSNQATSPIRIKQNIT